MNIFALIDCNNFYVSCERVFNPYLTNKPTIVLSNNDGCIISRSNEAKSLGIPMGAPFYKYKEIIKKNMDCPKKNAWTKKQYPIFLILKDGQNQKIHLVPTFIQI